MTCGALSTEDFQTYVIEHIALVDDDVADVRESLAGQAGMHAIMKEYETVAMGRIPRRLELVGDLRCSHAVSVHLFEQFCL